MALARYTAVVGDVTGAVGQLLIAEMLIEQYFETARRVAASLDMDAGQFELHVAEANRVYEGVWDHLDGARAIIAADERDVSTYDAIRAEQGHTTHMGLAEFERGQWQVDVVRSIATMGLSFSQTVSVRLNIAGAIYAREGLARLAAAIPEVDWHAARRAAIAVPESGRSFAFGRGLGALILLVFGGLLGVIGATAATGATATGSQCDRAANVARVRLAELRLCTGRAGPDRVLCGARAARAGHDELSAYHPAHQPLAEATAEVAAGLGTIADGFEAMSSGGGRVDLTAAAARVEAGVDAMVRACNAEPASGEGR